MSLKINMSPKKIILLTVFIDVIGISIVIPVLPFYVESFKVSAFTVTALFAVFAFCSFLSAPYLGALSDKIGRRPVLLVSILSTALGWFVFASAKNVLFLFIGRIIDGLAAGNFPIAQSYLTDLAKDEKERTVNLGLIGAIFGVAFVIGPAIGGWLGSISHSLPFWTVAVLASLNFILAYFNLPESHPKIDKNKVVSINPFTPFVDMFKEKGLFSSYLVWFIFGLAIATQQSIFALYLNKAFGFDEGIAGTFMAGVGIIIILNQGFLLKNFWLKYFEEIKLALALLFVFGIGYLIMAFSNIFIFITGLILISFGQSVLRIVLTSLAVKRDEEKRGEILGTLSSIMSLSMIVGPLLAGYLFEIKYYYPFLLAGIFSFIAFLVLYYSLKNYYKLKFIFK
jgi:multidrug resistance protein